MIVNMPKPVVLSIGLVWTCSSCNATGGEHHENCPGPDECDGDCGGRACLVCAGWGVTGDPIGPYGHVLNRPLEGIAANALEPLSADT
jgi:hypothetical protein